MNHFLITRFNLKIFNYDKYNNLTRTEEWTQKRFALFERYCLPSVSAQTNKNFKWVCFFSNDTSMHYKEKINSYVKEVPQLIPVFLDDNQQMKINTELRNVINSLVDNKGFLITTRLDNDDTIHKDFIQNIQQSAIAEKCSDIFYTFKYGYQYFEDLNVAVRIPFFDNHFLSRVESGVETPKTVMAVKHSDVTNYVHNNGIMIRNISDRPMWIEVIHGTNVNNDLQLSTQMRPVISPVKFSDFGLNIKTKSHISALSVFFTVFFSKRTIKKIKKRFFG